MNRKTPIVVDIISKYGSFSLPFLYFSLEHEKITSPCKYYLLTLKHIWNGKYQKDSLYSRKGINPLQE